MKYGRKCTEVKKYALQRVNCANPLVFSSTYVTLNVFKANTFGHLGERWVVDVRKQQLRCVFYIEIPCGLGNPHGIFLCYGFFFTRLITPCTIHTIKIIVP